MKTATTVEPNGIAELLRQATSEGLTIVLVPGPAAHRLTAPSPETALAAALHLRLDLTQAQSWILTTLMKHDCASRPLLHRAMSVNGPPTSDDTAVTVMVLGLRRKLKAYGITIKSVYGVGYRLGYESREKLRQMLAGCGDEVVAAAGSPTEKKDSEAA